MNDALYSEDLEILKEAVEEPVRQMIAVEVASAGQTREIARKIASWCETARPKAQFFFDANSSQATELWEDCYMATSDWEEDEDNPGLLVIGDTSPANVRIEHRTAHLPTSAGFWRTMNQLREKWDSLPTQTIFLITPEQYRLFTSEADHLKRWIPLKLHWLVKPPVERTQERERAQITLPDLLLSDLYRQDDLSDKVAAQQNWDSLYERILLAGQRGEPKDALVRRYYIPLMANAITLKKWEEAKNYNQALLDISLPLKPHLRWLHLRAYLEFRQNGAEAGIEVARQWSDLAQEKGDTFDKLSSLWTLQFLYKEAKQIDNAEAAICKALDIEPQNDMILDSYANFLWQERNNFDRAEEYYQKALDVDSQNANTLGSYANFLADGRKDADKAEEYYLKALNADSQDAYNLGNYAVFLQEERQDADKAEEYYLRAVDVDPTHAGNLGSYANFLADVRRNADKAEEYYLRAIDADSQNARNLGNYAIFLWEERNDLDRAEQYYLRAIDANPKNVRPLGSYAIFLRSGRDNLDKAEEYYLRAIDASPQDANPLSIYASFLWQERGNFDKAEEYYLRAVDADPTHVGNLGSYANFLADVHGNADKAEEYYLKALDAAPQDTRNLGNYAVFLSDIRKDSDKAEEYYLRAIDADPIHAGNLGNYASFLADIRKDSDKAEEYYLRAIDADPIHAGNLGNYASFLRHERKDTDKAQQYYLRAIGANPQDARNLGNYANFLCIVKGDYEKGEEYIKRAVEASNDAPHMLVNLAAVLLMEGKKDEGKESIDKVVAMSDVPTDVAIAVAFHRYIHFPREKPSPLSQLKQLLKQGLTAPTWTFDLNIERAIRHKHPNPMLLKQLAAVVTGKRKVATLNSFRDWVKA